MNLLWKDLGVPTDSFYEVKANSKDVPKTKFKIKVRNVNYYLYVCALCIFANVVNMCEM